MIKFPAFRAAALFAVCVCTTSTASAQWSITDLGDLPGGSNSSRAEDINNAGQVVGFSSAAAAGRAFMWQNGVMTNLGDLPLPGGSTIAVPTASTTRGRWWVSARVTATLLKVAVPSCGITVS